MFEFQVYGSSPGATVLPWDTTGTASQTRGGFRGSNERQ